MKKRYKYLLPAVISGLLLAGIWYMSQHNVQVLNPSGTIAERQRYLMIFTTVLGLLVVIPVFILTFGIAWKYRASNKSAKYMPEWDHHKGLEAVWWGIPVVLIFILAIVTWRTTHELDPYKPLNSNATPVTIQVVALEWKWLFIYPEQNIASVNYIEVPVDRPINFEITSDAPMNSFWIPQLGGQVYAMAGMQTKLHLIAEKPGVYNGVSANLSGEGFAGMKFTVKAVSDGGFDAWVDATKQVPQHLSHEVYEELAKPSADHESIVYATRADDLYDSIINKYMGNMRATENGEASH